MLSKLLATGYSGIIGVEAFSRAVTGAEVAAVIGIWRDMYSNGDEVASSAAALIRRAQAKHHGSSHIAVARALDGYGHIA